MDEKIDIDEMRAEVVEHGVLDYDQAQELLSRLEQAEQDADTYQTLYEQRAESLEQAEQALEATERQVVARSGETAAERIWRVRAEQAEQAVARVEKLLKDSEEVESVFTSQHDRIWIDCVRRALDGDGRG